MFERQISQNTDLGIGYFLPMRRSKVSFNLSRNGVGTFRIFKSPKARERLP
ncbi:hypothetical protein EZS27_043619, partial [termite gut metagenome]